ncbi:4696_t:CDS:2 [Funneliformis caledonium]|uniref:4696_t:CDS:1 n=1 Tax=Funneliformis caledonium TaxID=1117310 RepID=A0A9N9HIQ9_9GLOM|nr:4696_t:CDS:2 [Funneliformis caledonium]
MGRLVSPLDLRFSTFTEDEIRDANKLFDEKSGTLSGKFDNNLTESKIATINCEYNVLKRDFETKRNDCEIHDGCVDSLSSTSEQPVSCDKDREHANVKMGKECEGCPNRRTIGQLQAQFGKLCRIGSLGGNAWKTTAPKSCRSVHPHAIPKKDHQLLKVIQPFDTFEEKSRIATLINYKVLDSDPKEIVYYITCVAEFGFDHIIIIGETDYGMIFLDCYGRVFLWDDESQMIWPFGNSPEKASKRSIKGKDQLGWFVMNGIVYEYFRKWQDATSKIKEIWGYERLQFGDFEDERNAELDDDESDGGSV